MTLGAPIPEAEQLEMIDDEKPRVVSSLSILLKDLVNHRVAGYISESAALITTMTGLGLGIPHHIAQLNIRVKAAAFFNIELAASASMVWVGHNWRGSLTQHNIL